MTDEFIPRTQGVYSGEWLALWTNGEVRELYAEIKRLRAALQSIADQCGDDAWRIASKALATLE